MRKNSSLKIESFPHFSGSAPYVYETRISHRKYGEFWVNFPLFSDTSLFTEKNILKAVKKDTPPNRKAKCNIILKF